MKKVLVVQRNLTHYRKLLFDYIRSRGEYDIDVVSMGEEDFSKSNHFTFTAKSIFRYKNYSIQMSGGMIDFVKRNYINYDYIILEGAPNIVNNILICKFLKKKNISYIVWDAGRRNNSKMSLLRKLAQNKLEFVWKNASAIIAYSTLAKKYFLEMGIPDNKIFICQNTIYVGEFDKQIESINEETITEIRNQYAVNGQKIVLYVGAVEERKRIKDLIDAVAIVNEKLRVSLVIIGGGNQLDELMGYVSNKNDIYLLGPIINDVIKYFMAADLFVLPSEGGLSINQAMICGKPIVASSADGTELDLIENGKNGFLFEEKNVMQLANTIITIIENDKLCREMGIKSREIIDEKVNEETFYENFKSCLKSI